jgi:hypothetical protein
LPLFGIEGVWEVTVHSFYISLPAHYCSKR